MAVCITCAVLTSRQGAPWSADVLDLDDTGAAAAREAQTLALVQDGIATVRASEERGTPC
jgi:hypothetical protein